MIPRHLSEGLRILFACLMWIGYGLGVVGLLTDYGDPPSIWLGLGWVATTFELHRRGSQLKSLAAIFGLCVIAIYVDQRDVHVGWFLDLLLGLVALVCLSGLLVGWILGTEHIGGINDEDFERTYQPHPRNL